MIVSEGDVAKRIPPTVIDGIVLGMNVSKEKEEQIREIIAKRQPPIKVLRAHLSYLTFEMDIASRFSNQLSESEISEYQ